MAPVLAILKALARAIQRDLKTFQSIAGNNFFLFVLLLMLQPQSAEFLLTLFGLLLLFPLSSDPLAMIPAARLSAWPLTRGERLLLRLASIGVSPVFWVAVIILLRVNLSAMALFLAVAVAAQMVVIVGQQVAARAPQANLFLHMPFVPGRLGAIIRKDLREMLSVLDPYVALALSIGGGSYRFLSPHPDVAAIPILSILVALALSTYSQCLFCLDGTAGMTRYRLIPLRGWQILLAKDVAFLSILALLLIPLNEMAGLTFGLAALAIGHYTSVRLPLMQKRWRFTGGRLWPVGVMQIAAGTSLGFAEQQNRWYFLFTLSAFVGSLYFYGRDWDRLQGASYSA